MNGSFHWLTWKINIFVFYMKNESYCIFPFPLLIYEGNDSKYIDLVKYKGKLFMTCIDREDDFMEVCIMKSYNKK